MTYLAELWVCEANVGSAGEGVPVLCGWSTYLEPGDGPALCKATTRWSGTAGEGPTGICAHLLVSHGLYEMEAV